MRVLVTGAAGFVAPHVASAFDQKGHVVVRTDIRAVDHDQRILPSNLTSLRSMLEVTEGVDVVCHLGGVGDVYLALKEPHTTTAANALGTATLLEACAQNNVRKVVYASTWEVYGQPQYQPVDEKHPCNPDHPYSITKLAGEHLVLAYDRLKGLPGVALRLGTAYGPGMRSNSVFSIFIGRAMNGQPISIKGTGQQSRAFTHVRDIARAFVLAAESEWHGAAFNTVADEEVSIRQLAEMVVRHLPTEIVYEPARVGDVPSARVSAEKARQELAWTAEVRFADGLSGLVAWHQSQELVSR